MAQASILIDDLGYNLFLMGPIERAVANIEDGMVLLDSLLPDPEALVEPDPLCVVLLVKARRHLAAIKADTRDFAGARSVLQARSSTPKPFRRLGARSHWRNSSMRRRTFSTRSSPHESAQTGSLPSMGRRSASSKTPSEAAARPSLSFERLPTWTGKPAPRACYQSCSGALRRAGRYERRRSRRRQFANSRRAIARRSKTKANVSSCSRSLADAHEDSARGHSMRAAEIEPEALVALS